ncbi:MAG: GspM family type II secretion system protein ExeM, partial [Aeromonas sobria]
MMEKLQSWWQGISAREQRLVVVGGALLLVGLCYWSIWQPIANRIAER